MLTSFRLTVEEVHLWFSTEIFSTETDWIFINYVMYTCVNMYIYIYNSYYYTQIYIRKQHTSWNIGTFDLELFTLHSQLCINTCDQSFTYVLSWSRNNRRITRCQRGNPGDYCLHILVTKIHTKQEPFTKNRRVYLVWLARNRCFGWKS